MLRLKPVNNNTALEDQSVSLCIAPKKVRQCVTCSRGQIVTDARDNDLHELQRAIIEWRAERGSFV